LQNILQPGNHSLVCPALAQATKTGIGWSPFSDFKTMTGRVLFGSYPCQCGGLAPLTHNRELLDYLAT